MAMTFLELAATFFTLGMFATNIPITWSYSRDKSTGSTSIVPFLSTFLNCCFWLRYGSLTDNNTLIVVNGSGMLMATYCAYMYYSYTEKEEEARRSIFTCLAVATTILFYVKFWKSVYIINQLGFIACCFSIIMFASPLFAIVQVIKNKSAAGHISFPLAVMSLLVCVLWTSYGSLQNDVWIYLPNSLGALLSISQIVVYLNFGESSVSRSYQKV